MKKTMDIELDLGFVDLEIDIECGRIEGVWVHGGNFIERTAEELLIALIGREKFSGLVADLEYKSKYPTTKDRFEDEYGVPV